MNADQIGSLQPALAALLKRFRPFFFRRTTFDHGHRYLAGLMADLKRKSIEPIALAAGVPVRTLQEFLAFCVRGEERVGNGLQQLVVDEQGCDQAIGVLDASSHHKQGSETRGVQRQWCGERGKVEHCVVGQHLLYTDNHPANPFSCVLASDLYLPQSWAENRDRCREAKTPELSNSATLKLGTDPPFPVWPNDGVFVAALHSTSSAMARKVFLAVSTKRLQPPMILR